MKENSFADVSWNPLNIVVQSSSRRTLDIVIPELPQFLWKEGATGKVPLDIVIEQDSPQKLKDLESFFKVEERQKAYKERLHKAKSLEVFHILVEGLWNKELQRQHRGLKEVLVMTLQKEKEIKEEIAKNKKESLEKTLEKLVRCGEEIRGKLKNLKKEMEKTLEETVTQDIQDLIKIKFCKLIESELARSSSLEDKDNKVLKTLEMFQSNNISLDIFFEGGNLFRG